MPGGRPGRSGGSNRKPVIAHLMAGSYKPNRHGVVPGPVVAAVLPRVAPIPDPVIAKLGERGRLFAETCWQKYSGWNSLTLELLHEAAITLDELEGLRGYPDERVAQKTLISLLAALHIYD